MDAGRLWRSIAAGPLGKSTGEAAQHFRAGLLRLELELAIRSHARPRDAGAIVRRPHYPHAVDPRLARELLASAPPGRHVTRQRVPAPLPGAEVPEELVVARQQLGIREVVGMGDQRHEAVVALDPLRLLHPKPDGMLTKDREKRVILNERDGQLDHVAEAEWEDRAAAAGLRLERIRIGEGAVV